MNDDKAKLAQIREDLWSDFLRMRGVEPENACRECNGLGVKIYGSTATWRGGVGGQAITLGVCDHCWGSGDDHRPWLSHRLLDKAARQP